MNKISTICFCLIAFISQAQTKYFIGFTDKNNVTFDPYAYFDQKAIALKQQHNLPLFDHYDLPLNQDYVNKVTATVDTVRTDLRWLNGLVVIANQDQIAQIQQFPFVKEVVSMGNYQTEIASMDEDSIMADPEVDYSILAWQLNSMGYQYFKAKGITGKGVRVAILDAGFTGANKQSALDHIFKSGRYIDGWDFVKGAPLGFKHSEHGTQVLHFIAGKLDTFQVGLAPDIELLLARTEYASKEPKSEEEFWVKALEWAHQKGAQVVNSSLGYQLPNHELGELDGKTAMITKAANVGARKGLLIVNSAGNEGLDPWKRIVLPADADSVLAVGGIDPKNGVKIGFSSFGPTKDHRIKPNVCALGSVYWTDHGKLKTTQGTSFSSPLVAGFAACLLQADSTLSSMELKDTIEKSSSLYPYYDYVHGYGVPQASKFFGADEHFKPNTFELLKSPAYLSDAYYYIKLVAEYEGETIFYHVESTEGYLKEFNVVRIYSPDETVQFHLKDYSKGDIIRVFHRGNLESITIK